MGQHVKLALEDVALAVMGHLGFIAEAQLGQQRERAGNHLYGAFGRDFVCADGDRVMIVSLTQKTMVHAVRRDGSGRLKLAYVAAIALGLVDQAAVDIIDAQPGSNAPGPFIREDHGHPDDTPPSYLVAAGGVLDTAKLADESAPLKALLEPAG